MSTTDKPTPELPDEIYMQWPEGGRLGQTMPHEGATRYVRADRPSELRQGVDECNGKIIETGNDVGFFTVHCQCTAVSGNTLEQAIGKWHIRRKCSTQPAAQKTPVDRQKQANLRDKEICTPQTISKQTEGSATSMQILEVGKDQYGEPLTVMGKPNAVHALQTALASSASVDVEAAKRWCDFWQQSKAHEQWTLHDLIDDLAAKFPELVGGKK